MRLGPVQVSGGRRRRYSGGAAGRRRLASHLARHVDARAVYRLPQLLSVMLQSWRQEAVSAEREEGWEGERGDGKLVNTDKLNAGEQRARFRRRQAHTRGGPRPRAHGRVPPGQPCHHQLLLGSFRAQARGQQHQRRRLGGLWRTREQALGRSRRRAHHAHRRWYDPMRFRRAVASERGEKRGAPCSAPPARSAVQPAMTSGKAARCMCSPSGDHRTRKKSADGASSKQGKGWR